LRTTSIRTSFLRSVVSLIVLMAATLLLVTTLGSRQAMRELSARLIDQSAGQAEEQLDTFFGSIEGVLRASRAWWEAGLVDHESRTDVAELNALFVPIMDAYPQLTSMMLADDTGFEYLLFRDLRGGDRYEWYNRIVRADEGPDAGFEMRWTSDGELYREGALPEEARDYDPRRRPFYTEPPYDSVFWIGPYYFFITKDAGMTASYKWRDAATGRTRLVAYDLLLMDLSHFTAQLQPSARGKTFVMLDDGSLLGLPRDERWNGDAAIREALRNPEERTGGITQVDRSAQLMTAGDFGFNAVADAADYWRRARGADANLFRYRSGGEAWWGGFRPFALAGQTVWIGTIVPEDDFLYAIRRQRNIIIAIALLALIVGVGMAVVLARRFSRPLERLAAQTERVRALELSGDSAVVSRLTEVQQLADANAQMMKALESFARYVPMDLVRELLRRGEVARIGGRTQTLSILFTDIEGFTELAEHMSPEALTTHMAEYFSAMLDVLRTEHATVDKFIGDAIVAFWGAPRPDKEHARHAVRAILRCSERLNALNASWTETGLPPMRTRFGLNTGEAVVGNVGAPDRLNYTVLGDAVNLASRLESLNRVYGTYALAAKDAADAAGDEFEWRHIDRVAVKGRTEAVDIFEPLGERGTVTQQTFRRREAYQSALSRFFDGDFAACRDRLESEPELLDTDPPSRRLLMIARRYVDAPPPDWDGVSRHEDK